MTYMTSYVSNIARSEGDPKVIRSGRSSLSASDRAAKALGWFSIGLGLTELLAPRRITETLGMQGYEPLVRAYGAREICSGILSLSADKQAGLWSRVTGDAVDLATLMAALRDDNAKRDNVGIALALVLGITAIDVIAAQGTTERHSSKRGDRRLYPDRSGFPRGLQAVKGVAKEFQVASRKETAPALQPLHQQVEHAGAM